MEVLKSQHSACSHESHHEDHLCWGCKEAIEKAAARTQLKSGMTVLDIGCGPGMTSFIIATSYGADVIGVDKLDKSIEHANQEYKSKCGKVQFQVADISSDDFKFGNDQFDLVFSHHVMCSIEDKQTLLTRLLKCLKPGGILFIRDLLEDTEFEALRSERKDPSHPDHEDWMDQESFYVSVPTYKQLVRDAGFQLHDGDVKQLHASQYADEHHHHHKHEAHGHHDHRGHGDGSGHPGFPQLAVELVASKPAST